MGRAPCCPKEGLNRGAWTALEDKTLVDYIAAHGEGKWRNIPRESGLKRCAKSCRLRWLNYLRPDIKRGNITPDEEDLIIRLHRLLGNRWSLIAGRLPGRTDNEIKNYWNTILRKKLKRQEQSEDSSSGRHLNSPNTNTSIRMTSKVADFNGIRPNPASVRTVVGLEPSTEGEQTNDGTKSDGGSPPTAKSEEEYELENLEMDFSISEFLASDFSESELWKMCQLDNDDRDQQPLIFSEELLKNWTDNGCFQSQA